MTKRKVTAVQCRLLMEHQLKFNQLVAAVQEAKVQLDNILALIADSLEVDPSQITNVNMNALEVDIDDSISPGTFTTAEQLSK